MEGGIGVDIPALRREIPVTNLPAPEHLIPAQPSQGEDLGFQEDKAGTRSPPNCSLMDTRIDVSEYSHEIRVGRRKRQRWRR